MLVTPQTPKIGAVVGVMALGTLVGWRMLVAEPGCDLGKRAPQIVTDIKAAHDLPLWKHENCIDRPIDMSPYPNRPTSRECTWDDGQVALRTHLSEAAMMMSVHLRQKTTTDEAARAFRTVARLVLEQAQKLDGTVKGLIDVSAIDDALAGKDPYSRQHNKNRWRSCWVSAGTHEDKASLSIVGHTTGRQ
jgi:hypothetical protein